MRTLMIVIAALAVGLPFAGCHHHKSHHGGHHDKGYQSSPHKTPPPPIKIAPKPGHFH